MKRMMPVALLLFVALLVGCGSADQALDCGEGTRVENSRQTVCVYGGELLIETGFRCPASLDYQHDIDGMRVCASGPHLDDGVLEQIAELGPQNNVAQGTCAGVTCLLGERCVSGRCVSESTAECMGGVCEESNPDRDSDGVVDLQDNCPDVPNANQTDSDVDGIGNACDEPNDNDGDGVFDRHDNCPRTANASQADFDGDGVGDACDDCSSADQDNDGLSDCDELAAGTHPLVADTDGDGLDDGTELYVGTDALVADTDEDGLLDGRELGYGLNPRLPSTHKDGIIDGERKFHASCEAASTETRVSTAGTDSLKAVLPHGTTTTSVALATSTPTNRHALWMLENRNAGVKGFVMRYARPGGFDRFEQMRRGVFGQHATSGYTGWNGKSVSVASISTEALGVAGARNLTIDRFAPFEMSDIQAGWDDSADTQLSVAGRVAIIDEGDDVIVIGAFARRGLPESERAIDWIEHAVTDSAFTSPGTARPGCYTLGRTDRSMNPIDVVVMIDPSIGSVAGARVASALPAMFDEVAAASDEARMLVVPFNGRLDTESLDTWATNAAQIDARIERVLNCGACEGGDTSFQSVERLMNSLTSPHTPAGVRLRPGAKTSLIIVTGQAAAEMGTAVDPQREMLDFVASVGPTATLDLLAASSNCADLPAGWRKVAESTGGVTGHTCRDGAADLALHEVAGRVVAGASTFVLPRGAVPSSVRVFVDDVLVPRGPDGFVVHGTSRTISFYGPNRAAVAGPGVEGSVVSLRWDAVD